MLDPTLVTALMLQSRMTYVDFIRCQTSEALQDDVLSRTPTSNDLAQSSVRQFVLHMFGTEHQSSWYLLALFPDAHLLYVESQDPTCGFLSPDPTLWSRLHVMHRLEYIHLEGIDWEIQDLVNWLQDCALRGPLRVTHFKLRSPWSIDPDPIMSLLRVLHTASAPIRVLVLDGIAKAPVDLFIAIAQLLPQLEGLTLIRRDTERQSKKRLCRWDCPTYEYAACLRALPRLRYFGANFYWDILELSPIVTRLFESDFDASKPEPLTDDYMSDPRSMALPFAASCPTLESFVIVSDHLQWACKIRRSSANGSFDIDGDFLAKKASLRLHEWHPGLLTRDTWHLPSTSS